jgi:hypothetical protein
MLKQIAIAMLSLAALAQAEIIPTLRPPGDPVNYWFQFTNPAYFRSDAQPSAYAPDYQPGVTTFDLKGRPFMRRGTKFYSVNASNNGWEQRSNVYNQIKAAYPNWPGSLKTGAYADERVLFDSAGHAYTYLDTAYKNTAADGSGLRGTNLLLFSTDGCRTWKLSTVGATYTSQWQTQDQNTNYSLPPGLVLHYADSNNVNNNKLKILNITKGGSGSSTTISYNIIDVAVTAAAFGPVLHSGGNLLNSNGGNYHLVWSSQVSGPQAATSPQVTTGTRCFATTVNRANGANTGATFLGYAGNTIDGHNYASVTTTSDGKVWTVFTGHQDRRIFSRVSTAAGSTTSWGAPEIFATEPGGKTYLSLICGRYDRLSVAFRFLKDNSYSRIGFCSRDTAAGSAWTGISTLVAADKAHYEAFGNQLTFAKSRNLMCLSFDNAPNIFTLGEYNAWVNTFPSDNIQAEGPPPANSTKRYNNAQRHWPAMIVSDNGGSIWDMPNNNRFFSNITP